MMTHFRFVCLCCLPAVFLACAHTARVESDPPGAEVYVNGEKVGVTPVAIEDPAGWSKEYELSIRKEGYEIQQATLVQDVWNPPMLAAAGICGACTCGLAAIYFLPRSRHLDDRYNYALHRKAPLPPVDATPAPEATAPPAEATPPPDAVMPPAAAPGTLVPQSAMTRGGAFKY
jgi:hypothetical protein